MPNAGWANPLRTSHETLPCPASRVPHPASRFPRPAYGASVTRAEDVRGIFHAMQAHEEPLHVSIEATLAHLIGLDLHEGVMPPFRARRQLEGAELPRVGPRAGRGGVLRDADVRKEFVRGREHVGWRDVTT